jgi:hypothetical protein
MQIECVVGKQSIVLLLLFLAPFTLCEIKSTQVVRGATIGSSFQEQICLYANPFPTISQNNWTFTPDGSSQAGTLPAEVSVTLLDSDSSYRKTVSFRISQLSYGLYGQYELISSNNIGTDLVFILRLTDEGLVTF